MMFVFRAELNYEPKESIVYETKAFKAGVLRFSKWHLDVQSLIDFFTYHMQKITGRLRTPLKERRPNSAHKA